MASGVESLSSSITTPYTIRNRATHWGIDVPLCWRYRSLVTLLVWRDIKIKYRQSLLGAIWIIGQPLATMALISIVFGRIAKLPSEGLPYPLFCFVGIIAWNLVNYALPVVTASLVGNGNLLQKIYFPRILLPIYGLCSSLIDFAILCVLLVAILGYYGVMPGANVVYLPLFIMWGIALNLGIGVGLSALNVYFRDITYGLPFLLQVWFYLTPIAYPSSSLPDNVRWIAELNPMMWIVDGFRWSLLSTSAAPRVEMLYSLGGTLAVVVLGFWFFRRTEQYFSDVI